MSHRKKSSKNSSKEYTNIDEVEKLVDQIVIKNKEKLDKTYESHVYSGRFSIKNKDKSLFYLKKGDVKKEKDKQISHEIISKARENLGEKPIKKESFKTPHFESNNPSERSKNLKENKRILFGKKAKDAYKRKETDVKESRELLNSNKLERIVYKDDGAGAENNKNKPQIDVNDQRNLESDILEDRIKQAPLKEEASNKQNIAEKKAGELVKKRGIFEKKKESDSSEQKIKTDDSVNDFLDDDSTQLDENIRKGLLETQDDNSIRLDGKRQKTTSDGKGLLFNGKKNTIDKKSEVSDFEKSSDVFKPRFRVENRPDVKKDSDDLFLDEKLKTEKRPVEKSDSFENAESKAQEFAKSHLKNIDSSSEPFLSDKKQKEDDMNPIDFSNGGNNKEEHIFFDEHDDDSFSGWSPSVTDKERKEFSISGTSKTELTQDSPVGEINDIELPKDVLNVDSVKLSDLGFSENEWEELDFYSLNEPFAYVEVLRERESLEKCYFLVEVEMTEEEEHTLKFIKETINYMSIDTEDLEDTGNDVYFASRVQDVIREYNLKISNESLNRILYYLAKSSLGLGKIDPLMNDPNIEDISCDGANVPLFLYHRKFGSLKSNVSFDSEEELSSFVFKLAQKCGKHISIADPILDATMPDGSRIQMTLSDEITTRGSTFTIRKFRSDPFSPPDLIEFNTMSSEMVAYMWLAIENGINMLFAGGTASGKTTALNALSLFIPPESKIVSIEETRELNLPHSNWIPGVARSGFGQVVSNKMVGEIDMYDLMKAALRQRPEYILVGEIRGREAYVLFQAMATGHATYSTVHADSAQSLIHRLEGKPINIPRVMLQSLDVVSIHITTKVKNKRARRCKQVIEIIDIDPTTKEILTNEVFRWDPVEDTFVFSGKSYVLERIRAEKDLSREEMTDELRSRKRLVEFMNKSNVRDFRDVARLISKYMDNPKNTLSMVEKGVKEE